MGFGICNESYKGQTEHLRSAFLIQVQVFGFGHQISHTGVCVKCAIRCQKFSTLIANYHSVSLQNLSSIFDRNPLYDKSLTWLKCHLNVSQTSDHKCCLLSKEYPHEVNIKRRAFIICLTIRHVLKCPHVLKHGRGKVRRKNLLTFSRHRCNVRRGKKLPYNGKYINIKREKHFFMVRDNHSVVLGKCGAV